MREIVLPSTEPESEWLLGGPVQKVSPKRRHGILQRVLAARLADWAGRRGDVATEWRFRIALDGLRRPLVPDVAFLSAQRSASLSDGELEVPPVVPDIAVEIASDDRHHALLRAKVTDLVRAGTPLVIVVDPDDRTITTHDMSGATRFTSGAVVTHAAAPGLAIDVDEIFDALRRPDRM